MKLARGADGTDDAVITAIIRPDKIGCWEPSTPTPWTPGTSLAYRTGIAGDPAAARDQLTGLPAPAYWTSRRNL